MKCGSAIGNCPDDKGTKKCLRSGKVIPLCCFDMNVKTNNPYCYCVICRPKSIGNQRDFLASPNGKRMRKTQNARESIKALKKAYRASARGKMKEKEYHSTDEFLAKCREYAKTSAGKANRKRSYDNNKLSQKLTNGLNRILHGGDSPTSLSHMPFSSSEEIRMHFKSKLPPEWEMSDYGVKWTVDHHIPRSAYNHNDPDDVRRCWSPSNMHPMASKENKEKGNKVLPEHQEMVPRNMWPGGGFEI